MAYILVSDLRLGVDRSRPIYAAQPGSIWSGINGHLTRGGDFEKRKAFVEKHSLPAGTFGLADAGGGLYVFGSDAAPGGIPAGVTYQRLQHPDGVGMSSVLWVEKFNGKLFVIAKYTDGTIHYFNGVARAAMVNNDGIAAHLAALIQADTAYTTTVVGAVITVEHNTDNTQMAVATQTLNKTGGTDDQTATAAEVTNGGVGVKEKWTITIGGTFEAGDRFSITIDAKRFGYSGNPTERAKMARTLDRKVYAAGGPQLSFSGVDTAIGWTETTDAGAGQINMSNHLAGAEDITGLGVYQNKITVLSNQAIQIWSMDADPALNAPEQVIEGTGTRAPGSVRSFGDLDLFYLSDSGIRSMRARDIGTAAGVNDVGTLIDTLVRDWMLDQPTETVEGAMSVIDPTDGRYWLAIGSRIFVFTYFPAKKISAWSWYEPGFTVNAFATLNGRVYARSGDKIYLYGGDDNKTYDTSKVTLQLPFLSAGKPGHYKEFTGIDVAADGPWQVFVLTNPNDLKARMSVGELIGFTFQDPDSASVGHHTHVAPLLINESNGYASFSNLALYYEGADSEGGTE
jgi:hypothetical protein